MKINLEFDSIQELQNFTDFVGTQPSVELVAEPDTVSSTSVGSDFTPLEDILKDSNHKIYTSVSVSNTGEDAYTDDTLDKEGLPWDDRIHASTKTQTEGGVWKLKRKPKEQTAEQWKMHVDAIKFELRSNDTDEPTEPELNLENVEFNDVVMMVTSNPDKINITEVTEICSKYGVKSFPELSSNPIAIMGVYNEIKGIIDEAA